LVRTVSKTGGHLGPNLGVVELTLALHRVFDSPNDRILWDTGHQAYVHKLLTGRQAEFTGLRQAGGLSGYPSRAESPHDWIENSHASTSLSYAHGLSVAMERAQRSDRRVVAVIGDGAMTGGMAYEALNNLGHSGQRAIIVFNDNGRSYAPTVSKLTDSVARLRLNPAYLRQRARLQKMVREVPVFGDHLAWGLEGAVAGLREMLEPPVFFETLGVRYSGPFDGHDLEGLERALRNAAEYDEGPIVVHVLTQKGRGYPPAEQDDEQRLHDTSVFDPETGPTHATGGPPSYTGAFSEAIIKEAETRPEVVAITAAMPGSTGLLPFGDRFPDRLIDVGIAEQHAVTAATGMAMGGLRPVVAIYSTFLTRAFDQCMFDAGLHRAPVVFAIDRAGITGENGASHHGVLDMVLLAKVPGMTVFAPSSYQELQQNLHDAMDLTDGPVTIRWAKTAARQEAPEDIGCGLRARQLRQGHDLCIIAVGKMLDACEAVADRLISDGASVTLWDARVVKPLDPEMLADAATHPCVLTVEDGVREGGVGSAIGDQLAEHTLGNHEPRVRVLGTPIAYLAHAKPDAILAELGLDRDGIMASALSLLAGDHIPHEG
ncbi:MAG: 1-deoxy-D-xylulose-5-phosphate synthase, partial [Acidimicrobiales bacterium]